MELIVNGDRSEVPEGTTVADVVRGLTAPGGGEVPGGIAAAVNDEVVRRAAWGSTPLSPDDRVDVLTAVQGG
ncbi:sulfur carrier protein ThiS [Nocardiopsis sp. CNT312]|uniref:sulfur carrier protein ThiS n=1 Tax=Nocardiopsis sp. CNT312 TaxID=1137268 RepID=UPI000491956E|nr:sulfur carrier protein ThiS [Nocardiopsis sp. CNT312]